MFRRLSMPVDNAFHAPGVSFATLGFATLTPTYSWLVMNKQVGVSEANPNRSNIFGTLLRTLLFSAGNLAGDEPATVLGVIRSDFFNDFEAGFSPAAFYRDECLFLEAMLPRKQCSSQAGGFTQHPDTPCS